MGNTGILAGPTGNPRVFRNSNVQVEATTATLQSTTKLGRNDFKIFFSTDKAFCVIIFQSGKRVQCETTDNGFQVAPTDVPTLYQEVVGADSREQVSRYSFAKPLEIEAYCPNSYGACFMTNAKWFALSDYEALSTDGKGTTHLYFPKRVKIQDN